MSDPNPSDVKLLPEPARPSPQRQLSELSRPELDALASDIGLDPTRFKSRQNLVAAIHAHRQLIATLDRDSLVDILLWGRRPIASNATIEQLARDAAHIRTMRFAGLSHRGLITLARIRGLEGITGNEPVPILIRRLKQQEGLFERLNRKRRAFLGALVANMIGEEEPPAHALPPPGTTSTRSPTIKEEIEESGLIGGLTGRLKKSADSYLNQKMDEIEARIDRKLDEIDRRLAEWRDKEVANRIRILKITLWASVVVSALSLLYLYVKVYFVH